ncbi:hypothetical protein PRJ39_12885 [Lysobacter enzymogenes]|nr:hypothetical protein [Lysobacter sp. yr284]
MRHSAGVRAQRRAARAISMGLLKQRRMRTNRVQPMRDPTQIPGSDIA